MNVYTVPSSSDFLKSLAKGIYDRYDYKSINISKITVVLPNTTSCNRFRQIYSQINGKTHFLPKITSLDNLYKEIALLHPENLRLQYRVLNDIERTVLLSKIIENEYFSSKQSPEYMRSLYLARELEQLFDECYRENIKIDEITAPLMEQQLHEKWSITSNFIAKITTKFHENLEKNNTIELENFRQLATLQFTQHLQNTSYEEPIVIAGTTGSISATLQFIQNALQYRNTSLVLYAFDTHLQDSDIQEIINNPNDFSAHPQYLLASLINTLRLKVKEIQNWASSDARENSSKTCFIQELTAIKDTHKIWSKAKQTTNISPFLTLVECKNHWEEAHSICNHIKERVKNNHNTAIISNNYTLIEHIESLAKRFDLSIYNNQGYPLTSSSTYKLFMLCIEFSKSPLNPISILSLVKQKYFRNGRTEEKSRYYSNILEQHIIRRDETTLTIDSIHESSKALVKDNICDQSFLDWIKQLLDFRENFIQMFQGKTDLNKVITGHIKLLDNFCTENNIILWRQSQAAETLICCLESMQKIGQQYPLKKLDEYENILSHLLQSKHYTDNQPEIINAQIFTSLEARLLQFDELIIPDMNSENWHSPINSAWLNEGQRQQLNFKDKYSVIGQSSHDIISLISSATHTLLTRSSTVNNTITTPSPWIVKLKSLVEIKQYTYSSQLYQAYTSKNIIQLPPPVPTPPCELRPSNFSASSLTRLLKNPYAIYAKNVLNLKPLEEITSEIGAQHFGIILHSILEKFSALELSSQSLENLYSIAQESFKDYSDESYLSPLWNSRFEVIAKEFFARQISLNQSYDTLFTEIKGKYSNKHYSISAIVDRIDKKTDDDSYVIYDYKSGITPQKNAVLELRDIQLPLMALIMDKGGYNNIPKQTRISKIGYWPLGIKVPNYTDTEIHDPESIQLIIHTLEAKIDHLLEKYALESTPYLANPYKKLSENKKYNEYHHLSRQNEWQFNTTI